MRDTTEATPAIVREESAPSPELNKLQVENTRLHRALQAMHCDTIEWMEDRPISRARKIRVGLCDLTSVHGPTLLTIYEREGIAPVIRVSGAREWAESVIDHVPSAPADVILQDAARDVLIFLGERKL